MNTLARFKDKIPLIAALLGAFAIGLYMGRQEITKSTTDVKKDSRTNRQTVIVKEKDGREVTTINEQITATERIKQSQQVGVKRSKVNISALVGAELNYYQTPIYGLHVSKEFIGPITIGVAYINAYNGMAFITGGLNF